MIASYSKEEIVSLLMRILDLLRRLGLRYHLTGGLVSSYYGDPRYTQEHSPQPSALPDHLLGLSSRPLAQFRLRSCSSSHSVCGTQIQIPICGRRFVDSGSVA